MEKTEEQILIEKCRRGDSGAFGKLIGNYRKKLFSYLIKLSRDRETAEDLFQETLIKAWKGLNKYSDTNKFSSWLFSIAHNTAMDGFRKNPAGRFKSGGDEIHEIAGSESPEDLLVAKETQMIINNAFEILTEKQKEVFLLRQHGDLTFKEISELTGEPLNTVLGHMHYAVGKLKNVLKKSYVER